MDYEVEPFDKHLLDISIHKTLVPKGIIRTAVWCQTCKSPICEKTKQFNEEFGHHIKWSRDW